LPGALRAGGFGCGGRGAGALTPEHSQMDATNFVLRCVRAMEQTAHDRVLFYEQCIQTLSDELTRPGLMPADRDRIAREIASAMAALASCRKELQRNTH
jgi:hypothetical protein